MTDKDWFLLLDRHFGRVLDYSPGWRIIHRLGSGRGLLKSWQELSVNVDAGVDSVRIPDEWFDDERKS